MDESWRMRMGTSNRRGSNSETVLEAEDFEDVFGGPPRSVMARKLSADLSSSEWFYQEVFKDSDTGCPLTGEGQRLPEFMIPEQRRSKTKVKSWMSKSKSTSSSVLSFGDISPFRSPGLSLITAQEDVALSTFTSRLRPINVPHRWSSTFTSDMPTCKSKKQDLPAFGSNKTTYIDKNGLKGNEYTINNFIFGFPQPLPSPEILVDYHPGSQSPSSALSSHLQDHQSGNLTNFMYEDTISVKVDEDDEDEVTSSSYIIELNSHSMDANNSEAIDIDEAIAWAKEQFQG